MGKHSRDKGRTFEQHIATAYRERWPDATVRRSLQAHRPYEPDVVVESAIPWVRALWSECQHADVPQPLVKLFQAERDIQKAELAGRGMPAPGHGWLPIVVWRKSGAATINVTTRLWVLGKLAPGLDVSPGTSRQLVLTMTFKDFLATVREA